MYAVFSKILIIYTGLGISGRKVDISLCMCMCMFFSLTIVDVLFNHLNSVSRDSIK